MQIKPKYNFVCALYIYSLQILEFYPKNKVEIFIKQTFFFLPINELFDIKILFNYFFSYHTRKITIYKICLTISRSISKKTLDKNIIFYLILKLSIDCLLPHLYRIFDKCLNIGFCFIYFWFSIIIFFCKPKKLNYITNIVYYLIGLFNILEKALKFIFVKRIIYLTKIYELLLYNHFNTR